MARADLTTVEGFTYEYLDVAGATFSSYVANPRYIQNWVKKEIYASDIFISKLLIKKEKTGLLSEIVQIQNIVATGTSLSFHHIILSVEVQSGVTWLEGREVTFDEYEAFSSGGIFGTIKGLFAIKNDKLYYIGDGARVRYISLPLTQTTTLYSPAGLERAIAAHASSRMVQKQGDQPEYGGVLYSVYQEEMENFFAPEDRSEEKIDD